MESHANSNTGYGRKLFHAAVDGARSGGEEFLHGKPLTWFLDESFQNAWKPAAIGLCLGLLGACPAYQRRVRGRMLLLGILGGIIGFGTGMANRKLAASVASGAWEHVSKVRDERWLEENPIDYA
jgi:hypothetical protein